MGPSTKKVLAATLATVGLAAGSVMGGSAAAQAQTGSLGGGFGSLTESLGAGVVDPEVVDQQVLKELNKLVTRTNWTPSPQAMLVARQDAMYQVDKYPNGGLPVYPRAQVYHICEKGSATPAEAAAKLYAAAPSIFNGTSVPYGGTAYHEGNGVYCVSFAAMAT